MITGATAPPEILDVERTQQFKIVRPNSDMIDIYDTCTAN